MDNETMIFTIMNLLRCKDFCVRRFSKEVIDNAGSGVRQITYALRAFRAPQASGGKIIYCKLTAMTLEDLLAAVEKYLAPYPDAPLHRMAGEIK